MKKRKREDSNNDRGSPTYFVSYIGFEQKTELRDRRKGKLLDRPSVSPKRKPNKDEREVTAIKKTRENETIPTEKRERSLSDTKERREQLGRNGKFGEGNQGSAKLRIGG